MGQPSAKRLFSTVAKGVATLQLATGTWAGVPALGSAAARAQRYIPTLCQRVQLHYCARKWKATSTGMAP